MATLFVQVYGLISEQLQIESFKKFPSGILLNVFFFLQEIG